MGMSLKILKSACWRKIKLSMWVPKICSCSMKCSRCCVLNDMARGEKRTSESCAERNALCARTASCASARICRQCWVCSSARLEGVLSSGIHGRAMLGTRGEPEVCALSTGSATLSVQGGEVEADVATSTHSLGVWVVNGGKRRWMVVLWWVRLCCVVLCCVVLCCVVWCCVVLCCVVLCRWELGGVVGVVLCCVCCVVLCDVVLCCVV